MYLEGKLRKVVTAPHPVFTESVIRRWRILGLIGDDIVTGEWKGIIRRIPPGSGISKQSHTVVKIIGIMLVLKALRVFGISLIIAICCAVLDLAINKHECTTL
ncbi:hypothetical protein D3C85_1456780 [compost metagenome]